MELALKLASIFFTMILVDNYVLAKFLGICPFLGVSKKLDSAVGMSLAVTFVMVLATAATCAWGRRLTASQNFAPIFAAPMIPNRNTPMMILLSTPCPSRADSMVSLLHFPILCKSAWEPFSALRHRMGKEALVGCFSTRELQNGGKCNGTVLDFFSSHLFSLRRGLYRYLCGGFRLWH